MPSAVEMRVSLPKHLIVGGFFTFDEIGTINSTAIQTAPFDICLPLMVYYVITRDCMKQINCWTVLHSVGLELAGRAKGVGVRVGTCLGLSVVLASGCSSKGS